MWRELLRDWKLEMGYSNTPTIGLSELGAITLTDELRGSIPLQATNTKVAVNPDEFSAFVLYRWKW